MVEVLVSIAITSVVATMLTLFYLTAVDTTREADGRNDQASAARATLESWGLLMRLAVDPLGSTAPGADRIYFADPNSIRFCAALGTKGDDPDVKPPAVGVRLALEAGRLVEYRWLPTTAAPSGCTTMRLGSLTTFQVKRVLVQQASLVPGAWLVTPLDQADLPDGTVMNSGLLTSDLTIGTAAMTLDNRLRTAGLQLAFQTLPDPRRPASASVYATLETLTTGS